MAYPPEPVEIVASDKPQSAEATPVAPGRIPVGTAIAIVNDEGLVLMLQRFGKHGSGTWSFPGGWADSGEDPAYSACREALEEVGLEIDAADVEFVDYTYDTYVEGVEDVCLWFKTRKWKGEPRICEPEKITALEWRSLDELPQPLFAAFENALLKGIVPDRIRS